MDGHWHGREEVHQHLQVLGGSAVFGRRPEDQVQLPVKGTGPRNAAHMLKASTGVGLDRFHKRDPLNLSEDPWDVFLGQD